MMGLFNFRTVRWLEVWFMLTLMALFGISLTMPIKPQEAIFLRSTSIEEITEGQFRSDRQTKRIDLSKNKISSIHLRGFCYLDSLYEIDLSYNNLSYIHPDTFECTPNLAKLNLKSNPLLGVDSREVFLRSSSIVLLDISYCNFEVFSDEMFSFLPNLQRVIANENKACQSTLPQLYHGQITCGTVVHFIRQFAISNKKASSGERSLSEITNIPTQSSYPNINQYRLGINKIENTSFKPPTAHSSEQLQTLSGKLVGSVTEGKKKIFSHQADEKNTELNKDFHENNSHQSSIHMVSKPSHTSIAQNSDLTKEQRGNVQKQDIDDLKELISTVQVPNNRQEERQVIVLSTSSRPTEDYIYSELHSINVKITRVIEILLPFCIIMGLMGIMIVIVLWVALMYYLIKLIRKYNNRPYPEKSSSIVYEGIPSTTCS